MIYNNKIKVVWLCVQPLNLVAKEYGFNNLVFGGWLDGISSLLKNKDNIELFYIFPNNISNGVRKIEKEKIKFIGIKVDRNYISNYYKIINEIRPDVIHIFGTENKNINKLLLKNNMNNSVISIQGVMEVYSKLFYSDINKHYKFQIYRNIPFWLVLFVNKQRYKIMAYNERKVLLRSNNAIGRTKFDMNFINSYNKVKYHHNNEILRPEFYDSNIWNIDNVRRFQIYISQGNYPIKGLHILLKAVALLKQEFPNIKVNIAGEDILNGNGFVFKLGFSYGNFIKYIIEKEKLEHNIEFIGFKKPKEVIDLLLQSHLFVIPSSIENSPNSLGEAMLLGVPSVCSNVGGISSMTENKVSSYLYEYSNAFELADIIKEIFNNDKIACDLSFNSRKRANLIYNVEKNTEELIKIYQSIKEGTNTFHDTN